MTKTKWRSIDAEPFKDDEPVEVPGVHVVIPKSAQPGIVVTASPSQTENLMEWRAANGTVLAEMDAQGNLHVNGLYISGKKVFGDRVFIV